MKKFFLSPFFAPIFMIIFLISMFILSILSSDILFFYDEGGGLDYITYVCYVIAFFAIFYYKKDFNDHLIDFYCYVFLLTCALLREMGIQHYLTSTDTTAFKIRFFTNPNNPIIEKILSFCLIIILLSVIIYLLKKYLVKIIKGFFKFDTLYWTIAMFGGIGIISKIADRFPSNYHKSTGYYLEENTRILLSLIE